MFRPYKVILTLQEDRSKSCLCFIALWDPKYKFLLEKCKIHQLVYVEFV